jgi:hypothetical protein
MALNTQRLARALLLSVLAVTLALPSTLTLVVAQDIEILSHSAYVDTLGYYRVFGEVQNIGSSNFTDVEITATFYNASDEVVSTAIANIPLIVLLEGQKSPFALVVASVTQSAKIDHYTLVVSDYSVFSGSKPIGLEIVSTSTSIILDYFYVDGEIKNIGDSTASFILVVATFYNSTGHVVNVADNYANPHTIEAGETAPFTVSPNLPDLTPLIAYYALVAESDEFTSIPQLPSWPAVPTRDFEVDVGESTFHVHTHSNTSLSNFQFTQSTKELRFNVTGPEGTLGYCNVTFPTPLLGGPYVCYLDGGIVTPVLTSNATHTSLYFEYPLSTRTIEIVGTTVIPEFPVVISTLLLLTMASLMLLFAKRKRASTAPLTG